MEFTTIFDVSYTSWGTGPMDDHDKSIFQTITNNNMSLILKPWHVRIKNTSGVICHSFVYVSINNLQHGHPILAKVWIYDKLESGRYLNFYLDGKKYWFTNS